MECNDVQEKLSQYIDSVLDEGTLEEIESHLDGCVECRIELEAMRALIVTIGEIEEIESPIGLNAAIKQTARKAHLPGCAEVLQVLSDYVDGHMPESKSARVRMHVSACEKCAREMEMLERTLAAVTSIGEVEPPANLRSRIAAATTLKESVTLNGVLARVMDNLRPRKLGWAVAGVTAAAAIAGLMISYPQKTETPRMAAKPAPSSVRELPLKTPVARPEKPQKVAVVAPENALEKSVDQSKPVVMASNPAQEPTVNSSIRNSTSEKTVHPVTSSGKTSEAVPIRKIVHKPATVHNTKLAKSTAQPPVTPVPVNIDRLEESPEVKKVLEVAEMAVNSEEVKQEEPGPSLMKIAVAPPNQARDLHDYVKSIKQEVDAKRPSGDPSSLRLFGKRF